MKELSKTTDMPNKPLILGICTILFIGLLCSGCTEDDNGYGSDDTGDDWWNYPLIESPPVEIQGYSDENSYENEIFDISDNFVTMIFINLTWEDEPDDTDGLRSYRNQPDTFNFSIITPWQERLESEVVSNEHGEPGVINMTIEIPDHIIEDGLVNDGWMVTIHCGECGDFEAEGSIIGYSDGGNDWEFSYFYEYHDAG